jgi:hypothetical protein
MNGNEVVEAMQNGYAGWLAVLERAPEERMTENNAVGHWSVKDILAHIAAGHRWLAAQLDATAHRQMPTAQECFGQNEAPPCEYNIANHQDRNDWTYARHKDWPLAAVIEEADFAYTWLVRMIAVLPESAFDAAHTIAEYSNINRVRPATGDDTFRFPLWRLLYNGTAEHYPFHVKDIDDWLSRDA